MKGRKPKPSHLKLVGGNAGKRPLNENEPKPPRARPSAPTHISDGAREVWGQAVLILDEMGVLTSADIYAVEVLCEAIADHRAAGQTIKECAETSRLDKAADRVSDFSADGRYYRTTNQAGGVMWRAHPAVGMRSDADRRIKAWCAEFGLTPSARSRIETNEASQPAKSAASKYFTPA